MYRLVAVVAVRIEGILIRDVFHDDDNLQEVNLLVVLIVNQRND